MVGVVGNGKASNSNYRSVYFYIYIYIKSKTIGEQYNHNYKLGPVKGTH